MVSSGRYGRSCSRSISSFTSRLRSQSPETGAFQLSNDDPCAAAGPDIWRILAHWGGALRLRGGLGT